MLNETKFSMKSSNSQKSEGSYNSYLNRIKGAKDFAYGYVKKDDLNKDRQKQLDTIMEKFNQQDQNHKKMMFENQQRRKKLELKLISEKEKKSEKEKEILKNLKLNKESVYLKHLRDNNQFVLAKTKNCKNEKTNQNFDKIRKNEKISQNKENFKNSNINALDLDIHQSTDNLQKILKQYKLEDQENYGKVVDDFVTNLENEINNTEMKNPFLDSLDLENSQKKGKKNLGLNLKPNKKNENNANYNTFGFKKLDFAGNFEKMDDLQENKTLEELIGYVSDENLICSPDKAKSKPFSANTVVRKEINSEYFDNVKIREKNLQKTHNNMISKHKSPINKLKEKEERKTSCEFTENDYQDKSSKFKNKLFDDIANSRKKGNFSKKNTPPIIKKQGNNNQNIQAEISRINAEETELQQDILNIETQFKTVKSKSEKPKIKLSEDALLEESIEKLNIKLNLKRQQKNTIESKILFSQPQENKKTIHENDRYILEEPTNLEKKEFSRDPVEKYESEPFEIDENLEINTKNLVEKKKNTGYAKIYQTKNEENSEIARKNNEISLAEKEEEFWDVEGRINVINKENLKKLLLD